MSSLLSLSRSRYPSVEQHNIFTSLVDDLIDVLFDHAEVDTLVWLRSTGHVADDAISSYLLRKLHALLRRFVENVPNFLDELELCSAIISGSSALAILFRLSWTPQDLDVYAPREYFFHLVAYLVHVEGYTVSIAARYRPAKYADVNNIRCVARLSRDDGQRVDVIQSATNSPLLPLASFWNTAVMNYITPSTFCIAYPHLTDAHRGLISTIHMKEEDVQRVPCPTQSDELLEKYRARGFDLRFDHMSWARQTDVSATCPGVESSTCPLALRYFGDRHCVTGSFKSVRTSRSFRKTTNFLEELTAVWWRGGQTCRDAACGGLAEGTWVSGDAFMCRRSLLQ